MSTRVGNKIVSGNNAVHKANISLDNITGAGKEQIIVHVNENITELTLPLATESTVGVVKVDGATISITEDGTISANVPEIDTSELALKSELDAKQDAGDYALRSELPDVSNLATKGEIPDVSNLATKGEIPDVSNLATKGELEAKQDAGDYALRSELGAKQDAGDYALRSEIPDVSNLATKDEIPEAYELPTATIDTLGAVKPDGTTIAITEDGTISANVPEIDTSNLVTKDEVYTKTEIDNMIGDIETLLQGI